MLLPRRVRRAGISAFRNCGYGTTHCSSFLQGLSRSRGREALAAQVRECSAISALFWIRGGAGTSSRLAVSSLQVNHPC